MNMLSNSEQPLATFYEKSLGLRRKHLLFADKVTIEGSHFGGNEFVTHVPLVNLSADISLVRYRTRRCVRAVAFCGIFGFVLWVFVGPFSLPLGSVRVLITMALFVASLVLAIVYFPKRTAYRFVNTMGVIVLDVIESGPEKANARAFAEQIRDAILQCRERQSSSKTSDSH